jgi:hypothetical protein
MYVCMYVCVCVCVIKLKSRGGDMTQEGEARGWNRKSV